MVNAKSNEQLTIELAQLKTTVTEITRRFYELEQNINSRPRLSDLARSESTMDAKIKDNAENMAEIEQKLAYISLPEDTRLYLTENEVSDFRSNFNKLLAMLASYEQLYKNLVAYSVNNVTGTV